MKNPYLFFLAACIALGAGLSIYFGSQHYDAPVIERIEVANGEEMGALVYQKFLQDHQQKWPQILMLGVEPNAIEDMELWKGFLYEAQKNPQTKVDLIAVEENLPYVELLDSNIRLDVKNEMARLVEGVKKAQAEGLRIVILVPNIYSSQLITKGPSGVLQNEHKLPLTSLSVVKFPMTSQQSETFEPACSVDSEDIRGTGPLGCAIRQKAPMLWREKPTLGKYLGRLEKVGPEDYLILFNRN